MSPAQAVECMLLVLLAVCTQQDLCMRKIFLPLPLAGILAGVLITVISGSGSVLSAAGGILTGAALLIFGRLTEGAVGSGDGWMLAACGALLGFMQNLILLMTALFLIMAVSAVLLLLRRKKKTDTLPFVPFLLAAYLMMLAV